MMITTTIAMKMTTGTTTAGFHVPPTAKSMT